MKKLFLVLFAVALVGSFAFAEVMGADAPTLSGSVTSTFGYDLDTEASGFDTSTSVNVVVPLASGGDSHSGSGDVYAEITISDAVISIDEDDGLFAADDLDISAVIHMGDLYIGLGEDSLDFNMVDLDADMEQDGDVDDDTSIDVNARVADGDGIAVGYMTDAFSFEFSIASKYDGYLDTEAGWATAEDDTTSWLDSNETDADDDGAYVGNVDNDYVFGMNASFMAGPATVPVYFTYDASFNADDALVGIGAAPSIVSGDLTLDIPFDYVMIGDVSGMEIMPALSYVLADVGTIAADFFFAQYTDIGTLDATYAASGLADDIMELGVTFTEAMMDEVTLVVDFDLTHLADDGEDMGWNVNVDASYDAGMAAPYVVLDYGSNADMDLSIGAKLAVIDNATVTLDYTNGHLLEDSDTVGDEADKGTVTLAVAVTY